MEPPNDSIMGLGGVLVMAGISLGAFAIAVQEHADVVVPIALCLVALGGAVSLIARNRPSVS